MCQSCSRGRETQVYSTPAGGQYTTQTAYGQAGYAHYAAGAVYGTTAYGVPVATAGYAVARPTVVVQQGVSGCNACIKREYVPPCAFVYPYNTCC